MRRTLCIAALVTAGLAVGCGGDDPPRMLTTEDQIEQFLHQRDPSGPWECTVDQDAQGWDCGYQADDESITLTSGDLPLDTEDELLLIR